MAAFKRFYYQGLDRQGQPQNGEILAETKEQAKALLRQQTLAITKIGQVRTSFLKQGIRLQDISLFSRQLATLVEASLPLLQVLDIMSLSQEKKALQTLINHLKQSIAAGHPLSFALSQAGSHFTDLFCQLIRVGEQSGTLPVMLRKAASYQEKKVALRKKTTQILSYPLTILAVALLVSIGMMLFVVPPFQSLFKSLGTELPAMTQFLLWLSSRMRDYGLYVVFLFTSVGCSLFYAQKHLPSLSKTLEKIALQLPLFGPMFGKSLIASFSRTLALTFGAGLPLKEALQAAAASSGSKLYLERLARVGKQLVTGQPLYTAMAGSGLFPPMVISLITLGETSGTLLEMLDTIAQLYEEELENNLALWGKLIEPLILSMLGLMVGGLVIALYLPIFQLGTAM